MHSPLWHVMSSTNSAQPDFRFILDVSVVGAAAPVRLKISPDAAGVGRIDVSRVIRAYLTNYFLPVTGFEPFVINTSAITLIYAVYYGEEYGGAEYPSLSNDSYYAYNSYIGDTPGGYAFESVTEFQHAWATDRDINNIRIPRYGRAFLPYINDPDDFLRVRIQEIDDDGVPINIALYYTSDVITPLGKLIVLNLNLENINATPFLGSMTPAPIPTNAAGYRIALMRSDGVTFTPWAYVRWLCEPKTPATVLHFLNRAGGFETFHFSGPTRKSVSIDRKSFARIGQVSVSNVIREYNPGNLVFADTSVPFHTAHTWTRKLTSGYVDDVTHEWLWQLIASPQVYLEDNGYCYPVTIKSQRWEERLTRFDKMYNLELEITMGRNVISQSR